MQHDPGLHLLDQLEFVAGAAVGRDVAGGRLRVCFFAFLAIGRLQVDAAPRAASTRPTRTETGSPSRTLRPLLRPTSAVSVSFSSKRSPRSARAGRKPS